MDRDRKQHVGSYLGELRIGEPYGTDDLYSHRNGCQLLYQVSYGHGQRSGLGCRSDQRHTERVCGIYAYDHHIYHGSEWGIKWFLHL